MVEPRLPGAVERYVDLGACYDHQGLKAVRERLEGGVSISATGTRRLGVVLSGDKITVNVQDGGTQYSYAPRLDGMDRGLETGRASVWLEEDQAMTIGERTPLYLEIYDDGEGVTSAALPDSFFDVAYLNQYDRAYAVAVTLEG